MKNRADGQKDLDGSSSNAYAGTVRFLAIARYAAKSDILAIKEGLAAVGNERRPILLGVGAVDLIVAGNGQ